METSGSDGEFGLDEISGNGNWETKKPWADFRPQGLQLIGFAAQCP
jgi:hypothetical protein